MKTDHWQPKLTFYMGLLLLCGTLFGMKTEAQPQQKPPHKLRVTSKTQAHKPRPESDCSLLKLRGGFSVQVRGQTLLVFQKRKLVRQISLPEVLETWLKEDWVWGDHMAANQMRYQHGNRDNLVGVVTRIDRNRKGAEVIIEWRLRHSSAQEMQAVHVAQLTLKPKVNLEFVKRILATPPR